MRGAGCLFVLGGAEESIRKEFPRRITLEHPPSLLRLEISLNLIRRSHIPFLGVEHEEAILLRIRKPFPHRTVINFSLRLAIGPLGHDIDRTSGETFTRLLISGVVGRSSRGLEAIGHLALHALSSFLLARESRTAATLVVRRGLLDERALFAHDGPRVVRDGEVLAGADRLDDLALAARMQRAAERARDERRKHAQRPRGRDHRSHVEHVEVHRLRVEQLRCAVCCRLSVRRKEGRRSDIG